jgi:hypothetical protein
MLIATEGFCKLKEGSPEENYMAYADGIHPELSINKIKLNRYRSVMGELSDRMKMSKGDLVAQCYYAKKTLEDAGITQSCLEILEDIQMITNGFCEKPFSSYGAEYVVLRQKGFAREYIVKFMTSPAYLEFFGRVNQKDNQ